MINEAILLVFAGITVYSVHLFFRDKREARQHEKALSLTFAAACREVIPLIKNYGERLDTFKDVLVAVLKDMRELVKDSESERKRVAGTAAMTLLKSGRKLPQP